MELIEKNHPVLKTPAKQVSVKQGRETGRALLKFMRSLNRRCRKEESSSGLRCVGLAANQVGILQSVCVLSSSAYNELVLVNPKIISFSETKITWQESCLSLPGELYSVERPAWCDVQCDNHQNVIHFGPKPGNTWNNSLLMDARIVLHEIEHLHGILISDIGKRVIRWI